MTGPKVIPISDENGRVSTKNELNAGQESGRADDTTADRRFRNSTMTYASKPNSSYDSSTEYEQRHARGGQR